MKIITTIIIIIVVKIKLFALIFVRVSSAASRSICLDGQTVPGTNRGNLFGTALLIHTLPSPVIQAICGSIAIILATIFN